MAKIDLKDWEEEWKKIETIDRAILKNTDLLRNLHQQTGASVVKCRHALTTTHKARIKRNVWFEAALKHLRESR